MAKPTAIPLFDRAILTGAAADAVRRARSSVTVQNYGRAAVLP